MRIASKHKQRGWWQLAAAAAGALLANEGAEATNEANADQNLESRKFAQYEANSARAFEQYEAQQLRGWQTEMSNTQYVRAVADLKAAGINPMLAYQQGGAGTPSGGMARGTAASAPPTIPMQNATQAGIAAAAQAVQMQNVESQTEVNEATADKIRAEIPYTIAGTGQIQQQTKNLEKGLEKINEEIKNVRMDTLSKEEQITLTRAQQQLTNIQKDLARENISFTEAQTKMQKVLTQLRTLEVPEAQNAADFARATATGSGGATTIGSNVGKVTQFLKSILGK